MSRLLTTLASGTPPGEVAAPSFADFNTTFTNDLSADGISWANARPLIVDKNNNLILLVQRENGGTKQNNVVYSNNGGASWTDAGLTEGFIERGTAAYDSANDVLHVLWNALDATDGIIYRRYTIGYTSTAISSITKDTGVNLQLDLQDAGTMIYQHPLLLHINDGGADGTYGKLLAVWGARNDGVGNEVRASMCVLGATADRGKTAGNWAAPVTAATTSITQSPQVAYSRLVSNTSAGIVYPSIGRKTTGTNAKDVYLCLHNGASPGLWRWKRLRWNSGANDWSTGLTTETTITSVQRGGSDTGYSLKRQLGTFVVEDTANDRMIFGFPAWKSNADGDTWSFVHINNDDSLSSLVDVYSAGGAHSYAPTGDIAFDATSGRLAVSYDQTSTLDAYVAIYSGTTLAQAAQVAYSAANVDIPLLYPRYNGKLLMYFRKEGSPPQAGAFGSLTWG